MCHPYFDYETTFEITTIFIPTSMNIAQSPTTLYGVNRLILMSLKDFC